MRHIRGHWAKQILRQIPGCKPTLLNRDETHIRVVALLSWARCESGNGGNTGIPGDGPAFNPFCSTWPYTYPEYNSIGVRNYPDWNTGLVETLGTLALPDHGYEKIISALQAYDLPKFAAAVGDSDWGTSDNMDFWTSVISYTEKHFRQEYRRTIG